MRIIFAIIASFLCGWILTACRSEIDDNQSQITGVSLDGKVSVVGAILKNNTSHANSYSGYLCGIGPLPKVKRDYFVHWLSENVDLDYVCSAILDDGTLSILYHDKEKKISRIEIDFLARLKQLSQQVKGN